MRRKTLSDFQQEKPNQRDVYSNLTSFIESDACYEGVVAVLYGLRRTGKTTLMEQAYRSLGSSQCTFYEVTNGDMMDDIYRAIEQDGKDGKKVFFIDEITRASDFILDSACLADIFAKAGYRIIISGTDSLSLLFADNAELYDRTYWMQITHIPFAEHCRVLEIRDIDDYITFGGLMARGRDNEGMIYDYERACKYLDSAVADNIVNSIEKRGETSALSDLSKKEMRIIIEKMVELYSGIFDKNQMKNELKDVSVNFPVKRLPLSESVTDLIHRKKEITVDFARRINASGIISKDITETMVRELQEYLMDMEVLSCTPVVKFSKNQTANRWKEESTTFETYLVQPAVKYYHLTEGVRFIEEETYYKNLSNADRILMMQKLDEKIKGDMTEQIILFDTKAMLPKNYSVCKPIFCIDGRFVGEYDMLIYDSQQNSYWGFEIKHTDKPFSGQVKHLKNEEFTNVLNYFYGDRNGVAVLYRGESFRSETGCLYLNLTDFMLSLDKYGNVAKTMQEITHDLKVRNLVEEESLKKSKHMTPQVDFDND